MDHVARVEGRGIFGSIVIDVRTILKCILEIWY
jgi:hypothetical protein